MLERFVVRYIGALRFAQPTLLLFFPFSAVLFLALFFVFFAGVAAFLAELLFTFLGLAVETLFVFFALGVRLFLRVLVELRTARQ